MLDEPTAALGADETEHLFGVIDQLRAETRRHVAFRNRHADGIADALAQRPGGGLDARGMAVFRVPVVLE